MTAEPIQLILVRHGESIRNHASDLAHRGDFALLERQMRTDREESRWPLTDLGHRQAQLAGDWIRSHLGADFDGAYVSPYLRTRQTAEELALPVDWQVDERLREREWGDYSAPGVRAYSASEYLGDLTKCGELDWKSGFPGGESVLDILPRATSFLRDAFASTKPGRVIAVTHGGMMRAIQTILEHLCAGPNCPDRRLSNCCVVMYRLCDVDLDKWEWTASVKTAHPALQDEPETDWQPLPATLSALVS